MKMNYYNYFGEYIMDKSDFLFKAQHNMSICAKQI